MIELHLTREQASELLSLLSEVLTELNLITQISFEPIIEDLSTKISEHE